MHGVSDLMTSCNRRGKQEPLSRHSAAYRHLFLLASVVLGACCTLASGQRPATNDPVEYGPYNGVFLPDGLGLRIPVNNSHDTMLQADSPWTIYCWVNPSEAINSFKLVAGLGNVSAEYPRFLAVSQGKVGLWIGPDNELSGTASVVPGKWQLVAATFDGQQFHLYSNERHIADGKLTLGSVDPVLQMAPVPIEAAEGDHFGGKIASFTVLRRALSDADLKQLSENPPDFSNAEFDEGSKPWPVQTQGQAGYRAPQDPSTLPTSRAAYSKPEAIKRPPAGASLTADSANTWTFTDGWQLREARNVNATPAQLGAPSFDAKGWLRATVPGTVLTTMIDDGVYPDPDFGLNNMAIPESLNKQDYWYRNEFKLPAALAPGKAGQHTELTFEGINYKATVWLNGVLLGDVTGAFVRGVFDVSAALKPGKNVMVVRISPPPHPGIPNEQSILGGPGGNGGIMELDGPTFLATEGWDWIPAIRDRNSGIWQPVTLTTTNTLKIGDTHIVTSFPDHDITSAAIDISVPVTNYSHTDAQVQVDCEFEGVHLHQSVTIAPGESVVEFTPAKFPELRLQHPRLWWPNGYGAPELYHLKVSVGEGKEISDTKTVRFGVREITYELSLLDATGHLRRVEFSPTAARGTTVPVVDVSHNGMRDIPSADAAALNLSEAQRSGWQYQTDVASFAPGGEASTSITPDKDIAIAPYLAIKVNGVRIAVRGGNWGMDDSRKRVSREHLEPFFRLDRDAHLNMIRNWVGQDSEETFYDLADEYGMLVWNDFWESTQNYNLEAEDPALFLSNVADTIKRFRNHPSIALWCGRNEGVPQPIINMGIDKLVRTLDGTRYYSPSSNQVNLQHSGPYSYQDPALYFTALNRGFSVETGTPSMPTLESFKSMVAPADQWPISDAWAYHDWHQSGNGDTAPFMDALQTEFGAATSLEDFERKAQMLNYVDHRAIFEGMNANLWSPNSGRLLWMTQPAWPSTMWQILSSDYDTQASFYGTKKACEPLHVQLNLATYQVDVINTTLTPQSRLQVSAKVYSLANALLFSTSEPADVAADSSTHSVKLDLDKYLGNGVTLVKLQLADANGNVVSENLYWLAAKPSAYRALNNLPSVALQATATSHIVGDVVDVSVHLTNPAATATLENKLTLLSAEDHQRILPAYYSDNYISLLPGESKTVEIEYPRKSHADRVEIGLRGWNAAKGNIVVVPAASGAQAVAAHK
jgi:beta-galactosidase/beta-glucuronidase